MKKFFGLLVIGIMLLSFCGISKVMASDDGITLKQGAIYPWKNCELKNQTMVKWINTKPIEFAPNWINALVDGWEIDPGWAYDNSTLNSGSLMLGREIGTLGKYVKFLEFPLLDKITITIQPIGLYAEDLFHKLKTQGATGVTYFSITGKF
jgi:hypothetical protein